MFEMRNEKKRTLFRTHENVNLSLWSIYIGTLVKFCMRLLKLQHEIIPTSNRQNFKLNATTVL